MSENWLVVLSPQPWSGLGFAYHFQRHKYGMTWVTSALQKQLNETVQLNCLTQGWSLFVLGFSNSPLLLVISVRFFLCLLTFHWIFRLEGRDVTSSSFLWFLLTSSRCLVLMDTVWHMGGCHQHSDPESVQHPGEASMTTVRRTISRMERFPRAEFPRRQHATNQIHSMDYNCLKLLTKAHVMC